MTGTDLVHMLAEKKARSLFVDMMASAGLGNHRIAKEVFYFLPQDLLDVYEELWYMGTGGKDGGNTGARGKAAEEAGALGKAGTDNSGSNRTNSGQRGTMYISGGGSSKRKKYKKYWVIADEEALEIKDRVDKRLRGLARDIRRDIDELKAIRKMEAESQRARKMATIGKLPVKAEAPRCRCGRIMRIDWDFCPFDGNKLNS